MSDPFLSTFPQDVQDEMSVMVTVVQLCGGAFLWLAFAKVPSDLNCVRRRWWGILALYLPCKWLSVASVLCEMVYACAFPFGFAQTLGKVSLILRLLSLVFAFAIFLLQVNTLWRNSMIWSLTVLSQLAIMAAIGLELFRLDQAYVGDSHVALVSLTLYLSTVVFTFGTLGMLTPAGHKASNRLSDAQPQSNILHRLLAEMDKGGTVSLAVFWLSSVVISAVFLALRNWSPIARRSLCYVAWLVIIQAACRQYERLAEQKNIFLAPSLSFQWLTRCLPLNPYPHCRTSQPNGTGDQTSETKQECEPTATSHSQSSAMQPWLELDLSGAEKIEIDVFSRDVIARRPFAQAIKVESEPSTSASSSQLSSPVFSSPTSTTAGCTSAGSPTTTSVSQDSPEC